MQRIFSTEGLLDGEYKALEPQPVLHAAAMATAAVYSPRVDDFVPAYPGTAVVDRRQFIIIT